MNYSNSQRDGVILYFTALLFGAYHPAVRLLRDRDIQKGTELVPTLRAYLNCGMNMTHAADQLYIHRTTFCRRMEQISHLTGITEFTSDLTLDLLISLKLLEEAQRGNEDPDTLINGLLQAATEFYDADSHILSKRIGRQALA